MAIYVDQQISRLQLQRGRRGPERATTSAPFRRIHGAIARAKEARRLPDRGGALPYAGRPVLLPNGDIGGAAKIIRPQNYSNGLALRRATEGAAANRLKRQALSATLVRSGYLMRNQERTPVRMVDRLGGIHYAQRDRPKPNAFGGVVGYQSDRLMPHGSHRGFTYAQRTSPAPTRMASVAQRRTASTAAPRPISTSQRFNIAANNISAESAIAKSVVLKSSSIDRTTSPGGRLAATTATQDLGFGERSERILLLLAIAGAAWLVLRR